MPKLIAPKVNDVELADAIRQMYRDLNMIYDLISKDEKKSKSADSSGKSGDIRITTTGNKKYLEGKGDEGWSRVEMVENISDILADFELRITALEP